MVTSAFEEQLIVKIYAEDSKVFTQTDKETYQIRLRFYLYFICFIK